MGKTDVILVVWIVNSFQNAMSCGVEADNSAKLRIMDNGVLQPIELIICGRQGENLPKEMICDQNVSSKVWKKLFPLKTGDRVKIIKVWLYDLPSGEKNPFVGRTGTIDWINIDEGEAFIVLDHRVKRIISQVHVTVDEIRLIHPRRKKN